MDLEERYAELRGHVFGIAYRMLGSASDAEDVVQDAFVRLQRAATGTLDVRNPEAYLVTVATRLAIDRLRSARWRREWYVGNWIHEPQLAGHDPADPAEPAVLADSLSLAVLVLLERLSPVERAVFMLREGFGYGYDEIAAIVDRSEVNCRQVLVRAKRRVAEGRPRYATSASDRRRMVDELIVACEWGDLDGLVGLLAEDVALPLASN